MKNEEATFNICRSIKKSGELQTVSTISYRVDSVAEVQIEKRLGIKALVSIIMDFDSDCIEEYDFLVDTLEWNEYRSKPKKLELYMKHH